MTKQQRTWLAVFLVMFLVPEVLWSPVGNLVFDFFQRTNNVEIFRPNFLTVSDNINLLLYVVCFQFIGILGSTIIAIKANVASLSKLILVSVMTIVLLVTGFVLYVIFSLRHGIGF